MINRKIFCKSGPWNCVGKISSTWKLVENEFGPVTMMNVYSRMEAAIALYTSCPIKRPPVIF